MQIAFVSLLLILIIATLTCLPILLNKKLHTASDTSDLEVLPFLILHTCKSHIQMFQATSQIICVRSLEGVSQSLSFSVVPWVK